MRRRMMMQSKAGGNPNEIYWHYSMGVPDDFGFVTIINDRTYAEMTDDGYHLVSKGAWKWVKLQTVETFTDNVVAEFVFTTPNINNGGVELAVPRVCGNGAVFLGSQEIVTGGGKFKYTHGKQLVKLQLINGAFSLFLNGEYITDKPRGTTNSAELDKVLIASAAPNDATTSEIWLESIRITRLE